MTHSPSSAQSEREAFMRDSADLTKAWGEISASMYQHMSPWEFYQAGWHAARAAASAQATEQAVPTEFVGVEDQIKRGNGAWRPCTGCYDTEDGHPTQRYADSHYLQCALGNGCSECGGLGAVWDDFSGYEEFAALATTRSPDEGSAQATQPPDPTDIQGWSVTVNVNAQDILTIGHNSLSGIDNIGEFADVVRNCAEHLVSFIGATPPSPDAREAGGGVTEATRKALESCAATYEMNSLAMIGKEIRALLREAADSKDQTP